jgi:hypothetical protein
MPATPLKAKDRDALLHTLQQRFERHPQRHPKIAWADVLARLQAQPDALRSLHEMEHSGGEPDVVAALGTPRAIAFCDCAEESPAGRRSLCFDDEALHARKENKPAGSALGRAAAMGIALLSEAQYRTLQTVGAFDLKTSSWIATPPPIRQLGGALFGDRRYDTVFTYHNGASSYYAVRGFRGLLAV